MSILIGCCLEGVFHPIAEEHRLKICLAMRKTLDAITLVELVPATALLVVKEKGEEDVEEKEIDSWLNWNFADYVSDCPAAKTPTESEERQEIISGTRKGYMGSQWRLLHYKHYFLFLLQDLGPQRKSFQ